MTNILTTIINKKYQEVVELKNKLGKDFLVNHMALPPKAIPFKFKKALQQKFCVVAEIKRRSPSKGSMAEIPDVIALAQHYYQGGAAAISVLTDRDFFGGSLEDLKKVSDFLFDTDCAVLRKDFIVDPIQLIESRMAGADAILLIVSVLQHSLADYIRMAKLLNLDALVEVHHSDELSLAIQSGAEIIGINNRNLENFKVDTSHALSMIDQMPDEIIKVSESGIENPRQARLCRQAGFNAVLVGEALVKNEYPALFIKEALA